MAEIKTYGCIGEHLTHSFSKEIHLLLGQYDYQIQELVPDKVSGFLSDRNFCGINVTIPYKQTVIPYLDEIDDAARQIHAVNTIVHKNNRLYGYNTDFYGMSDLITRNGISLNGKKVLILGTGGTGKTAVTVASSLGAKTIVRVSRTAKDGAVTYEEAAKCHRDGEIIINTTPVGMFPNIEQSPIEPADFPMLQGVVDVIYNPLRTMLVQKASACGIKATGGLYMLVAQAVRASEYFIGKTYTPDTAETVYRKILAEKRNIVLIGMPSCGKITVGRRLSEKLGCPFIDTDAETEKHCGKSIPAIFAEYGEAGFRERETEVIRSLSMLHGCVIATGGGAVLNPDNVTALRHNGILYFLDRNIDGLLPTADRPTADSKEAIRQRYAERYPIYSSAADVILKTNGIVEDTVGQILTKER